MIARDPTDFVSPRRRFTNWRETICHQLIGVDMEVEDADDFMGSFSTTAIGSADFAVVSATPMWVYRRDDLIQQGADPAFLVNVLIEGHAFAAQGANQFVIDAGDVFIQNTSQPYTLEFSSAFRIATLRVPEALIRSYMTTCDAMCSIPLSLAGKTASVASCILMSLNDNVSQISVEDAELAVGTALTMIGAASGRLAVSNGTAAHASFVRTSRFIDQNLRSPQLNASYIAAAAGITVRQLNRLFEAEHETVSRLILRRRLERCRLDLLSEGLSGRAIGEIAYSWGFNNLSHFSESFRLAYGSSPREVRRLRFQQTGLAGSHGPRRGKPMRSSELLDL